MIRIYDTRLHRKIDFEPLEAGKIRMYVCGPTVYNLIHIGNARTFISFDVIRRYFEWRGYEVTYVQNVTDVDDKIIAKANEEGRTAEEVAQEFTQAFIDDMHAVGVKDPTVRPRATEEIDTMVALVKKLIDTGHAYATDEGDVYFDVRSFPSYGLLSGRNIDDAQAGHRDLRTEGIEDRKHDPLDFAVWKAAKPGEPSWESPWGQGRPGWHIECSCMSQKYLGLPFDIHGGGSDLVFPHHENERAQSEAAYGCEFTKHWMHGGMLQINGEKMSKSLDNFFLLRDILTSVNPRVLRFLMLQTHYRSPLDFSDARVEEAATAYNRIVGAVKNIDWACSTATNDTAIVDTDTAETMLQKVRDEFIQAMDDDFNTSRASAALFEFIAQINTLIAGKTLGKEDVSVVGNLRAVLLELTSVFGLDIALDLDDEQSDDTECYPHQVIEIARELAHYEGEDTHEAVDVLLEARANARAAKDWACADAVRDKLAELGFTIMDTPQGARVEYDK